MTKDNILNVNVNVNISMLDTIDDFNKLNINVNNQLEMIDEDDIIVLDRKNLYKDCEINESHYTQDKTSKIPFNFKRNFKILLDLGKLEYTELKIIEENDIKKFYTSEFKIISLTPTGLLKELYRNNYLKNNTVTDNWKRIYIRYENEKKYIRGDILRRVYASKNGLLKECLKKYAQL